MDFCDTKENIGPLFLVITEAPYRFVKCDPDGFQLWGKRKGQSSKRYEQVSKLDYITNNMLEKVRSSVETAVSMNPYSEFSKTIVFGEIAFDLERIGDHSCHIANFAK